MEATSLLHRLDGVLIIYTKSNETDIQAISAILSHTLLNLDLKYNDKGASHKSIKKASTVKKKMERTKMNENDTKIISAVLSHTLVNLDLKYNDKGASHKNIKRASTVKIRR